MHTNVAYAILVKDAGMHGQYSLFPNFILIGEQSHSGGHYGSTRVTVYGVLGSSLVEMDCLADI